MINLKNLLSESNTPRLIKEGLDEVNKQFDKLDSLKKSIESQMKEFDSEAIKYNQLITGLLKSELDSLKSAINSAYSNVTCSPIDNGFYVTINGVTKNKHGDYIFKNNKDGFVGDTRSIKNTIQGKLSGDASAKVSGDDYGIRPGDYDDSKGNGEYEYDDLLLYKIKVELTQGYIDKIVKTKRVPYPNIIKRG